MWWLKRAIKIIGDVKMVREPAAAVAREQPSFLFLRCWLAVIVGVIIAYQIATLARQGLWLDEIITVMVTLPEHSLKEVFQDLLYETNPPLHFVLIHFWQLVAPRGDWSMRVPGLYIYTYHRCSSTVPLSGNEYRETHYLHRSRGLQLWDHIFRARSPSLWPLWLASDLHSL